MGKFTNRLKQMQEQWSATPSGFPEIPPGEYTMQISGASLKESESSGNLRAVFHYTITEGEQEGETLMDGYTLDTEKPAGMRMLKGMVEKIGREVPEQMDRIEAMLSEIACAGIAVRAQVKKSGDFTNVKVLELLSEGAAPAEKAEESAAEEEEQEGFKVADRVTFKSGKESIVGSISAIGKGVVTIESDDGDEWEDVPVSALRAAPAAPAAPAEAAPVAKKKATPAKSSIK